MRCKSRCVISMPESRFDDDYGVFRCTSEEPEHMIHSAEVRGILTKWIDPWIGRHPALEPESRTPSLSDAEET